MRSRQMLVKLDRLDLPSQEPKCPDISLLSPAAQDRVFEQFRKNRNSPNEIEPTINRKVRDELERLGGRSLVSLFRMRDLGGGRRRRFGRAGYRTAARGSPLSRCGMA